MSYESAFAVPLANYKNICIHQTFGHLFPDKDHYEGTVRIASDIYGQTNVVDETSSLPDSSPWWFAAINDFATEVSKEMEDGEVSEFKVSVDIVQCFEELEQWQIDEDQDPEEWQQIHINQHDKTILIKPF